MEHTGYERRWCRRCHRRTFHWLDDSHAFARRECDECGSRSGIDILLWIKRFALPVAVGITMMMVTYDPARGVLGL